MSVDTFSFFTQLGRLDAKLQAQNKAGEWKDIELLYYYGYGCSESWSKLSPNKFWSGQLPTYEGVFATTLRLAIQRVSILGSGKSETFYSNTVEGNINPAQLWRHRMY